MTKKRQKYSSDILKKFAPPIIISFFIIFGCAAASFFILYSTNQKNDDSSQDTSATTEPATTETTPQKPSLINLQSTVDDWLASAETSASEIGVLVYDFDNQQLVASVNPDEKFSTASLYKLFVVYEGYREIEQGTANPDQIVTSGYTYKKCLDLAIRESNSACAETLHSLIGRQKLQSIVEDDWKITNTSVAGLTSTPSDILKIIQKYYYHTNLTSDDWATISDSMLNQPVTTYDWRRGLPAGFTTASVYNKVGWDFEYSNTVANLYHDAAIVEFPETKNADGTTTPARHYAVVVMSSDLDYRKITRLGSALESAVLNANNS